MAPDKMLLQMKGGHFPVDILLYASYIREDAAFMYKFPELL